MTIYSYRSNAVGVELPIIRNDYKERAANTFGAGVRAYIAEYARPETRNWLETARLLGLRYHGDEEPEEAKGGLVQRWADRPVAGIDAHDVWSVIDEARRITIPGITARNRDISDSRGRALFAALSSMFSWLKRQRRIESNPCAGVHRPAGPKARDRVLTADEMRWFWRACRSVDAPLAPGAPRPFETAAQGIAADRPEAERSCRHHARRTER